MATDKLVDFDHVTDYISREDAVQCAVDIAADLFNDGSYDSSAGASTVGVWLKDLPAADVVEVVRCRDCKHRPVVTDESHPYGFGLACPKEGAYQDVTCPYLCDDGYYNRMPADGWYCADGERRADNG